MLTVKEIKKLQLGCIGHSDDHWRTKKWRAEAQAILARLLNEIEKK
jgi:hypothetical protein